MAASYERELELELEGEFEGLGEFEQHEGEHHELAHEFENHELAHEFEHHESAHEFEYFTAHYHDGRRRDVQKTGLARERPGAALVERLHFRSTAVAQIRQ